MFSGMKKKTGENQLRKHTYFGGGEGKKYHRRDKRWRYQR